MKILLLHGFLGNSKEKKECLVNASHSVCCPRLSNISFRKATKQAQFAFDMFRPDIIIGSSRGSAVALAMNSGAIPLILLAPAWKRWHKHLIHKHITVIHGTKDTVIPITDSIELVGSGNKLLIVDDSHRLVNNGMQAMMQELNLAVKI